LASILQSKNFIVKGFDNKIEICRPYQQDFQYAEQATPKKRKSPANVLFKHHFVMFEEIIILLKRGVIFIFGTFSTKT